MAEKSKERSCKLAKLDRVVGLFFNSVDQNLSTEEKISEIACRIMELLYQEGIIDEEGGEEVNLEAFVCRAVSRRNASNEMFNDEIHNIMNWISDLSVDHSIQSAREGEVLDLFRQSQKGEGMLDNLKEALTKMFEETEDGTFQMSINARIEMNRRRVKNTGMVLDDEKREMVKDASQREKPFEDQDKAFLGEVEMRYFLATIALSVAQKKACQSDRQHEKA